MGEMRDIWVFGYLEEKGGREGGISSIVQILLDLEMRMWRDGFTGEGAVR